MSLSQAEQIFHRALEFRDANARAAYLNSACGGDPALRAQVEQLLRAHDAPTGFLDTSPDDSKTIADQIEESLGSRIGRYKLLEKLGEGGCGVVYVAEQIEPVRRRVALKVIKLGMDTKAVVARFEAERQALAMMDHPNIAKVLDAGTTEQGRPYFVMELVRGIRITDYCDQNNFSTKDRLDLFIKICHAIQHAHQKGIIHRDIKPSNILVTLHDGTPIPKVIDFGIAKATEGRLTDATVYTQLHQFIGTPAYMSPEQAEMSALDVDTRSDIYSLGVLLYELLTGRTPFDPKELMASGIDAMRKTIREREPARPSTKVATLQGEDLTTTAKRRSLDAPGLVHLLKGDLDWIVMKCLEKDRTRRYETANGLAADLKRHLNNEPVVARPPSLSYQIVKFARRNRALALATGGIAAALVIGMSLALLGFVRERAARAEANAARLSAEAQQSEAEQARTLAEASARRLRIQNYVADMRAAQQDLSASDLGAARVRLRKWFPTPGQEDLRAVEWFYLWEQTRGHELLTLAKQDLPVVNALFSPNGLFVVSIGQDGRLLVRGANSGSLVANIAAGENALGAHNLLGFSPDGRLLAAQGESGLLLIETDRWTISRHLPGAYAPFDFSSNGRWLAAWSEEGVKLWSTDHWQSELFHSTTNSRFSFLSMRFSPDARYLAFSQQREPRTQVWDIAARKQVAAIQNRQFFALRFSPDSRHLLMGRYSHRQIARLDIQTGRELPPVTSHDQRGIYALALSPDGATLATAGADQTIRLWDAATFEPRATLRGHENEVWSVAFSPDGRQLISAGIDGTVRLWPTNTPVSASVESPLLANERWRGSPFFSANSSQIIAVGFFQKLAWSAVDGRQLGGMTDAQGIFPSSRQHSIGRMNHSDGTSSIVDLETGRTRGTFPTDLIRGPAFVISSDSDLLAGTHPPSGTGKVWDIKNQKLRFEWTQELPGSQSIALSPDGKLLARLGPNHSVVLHDSSNGRPVRSLAGPKLGVPGLAFSSDGKTLAGGSHDSQIYLWGTATGQLLCPPLKGHRRPLRSMLFFSQDGRTLISNSDDGTVRFWNVQTGQELLVLEDSFYALLSPDGRYFARLEDKDFTDTREVRLLITRLPTAFEAEERNAR